MQEIYHYSIIELFRKIGQELGYLPIKEYSLLNVGNETTEERVDLVWIKGRTVEYAFEFETTGSRKALGKLLKLSDSIKKYIFFVNKSLNFESINAVFVKDDTGLEFLRILKAYGIKVTLQGVDVNEETDEDAVERRIRELTENGI